MSDGTHDKAVGERMEAAKAEDKSASRVFNVLKEKLCPKVRLTHLTPPHNLPIPSPRLPIMESQKR